jgi:hypothetical protein
MSEPAEAAMQPSSERALNLHYVSQEGDYMRLDIFGCTVFAVAAFSSCTTGSRTDRELSTGPVRTVAGEPGVVPPGVSLVVRANDTVNTKRAYRSTIYDASVAEDVLDQHGSVLIPKESPVELVVRSLSYLGPGGVGMTELALAVQAVTVNGVRYPVESGTEKPNAGGLEPNRQTEKSVGGAQAAGRLLTRGGRINVPAGALLIFRIEDPIRLRGYQR